MQRNPVASNLHLLLKNSLLWSLHLQTFSLLMDLFFPLFEKVVLEALAKLNVHRAVPHKERHDFIEHVETPTSTILVLIAAVVLLIVSVVVLVSLQFTRTAESLSTAILLLLIRNGLHASTELLQSRRMLRFKLRELAHHRHHLLAHMKRRERAPIRRLQMRTHALLLLPTWLHLGVVFFLSSSIPH